MTLLHELLEQSAHRDPRRQAVVSSRGSCTYAELDQRSSALAESLRARGVRAGDRVGIFLPKSIDAVVAIFGILKAGAVYVPLDPFAPPPRLRFMIENCAMSALVSSVERGRALGTSLPVIPSREDGEESPAQKPQHPGDPSPSSGLGMTGTSVHDGEESPAQKPQHPGDPSPSSGLGMTGTSVHDGEESPASEDLAYILYTSGSTGTPKGVSISHRASLAFVNWAHDAFRLTSEDRVSSHAPFHFDLSIFDIFATIKAGGTIVLVPHELSVFPIDLAKFIDEQRISVWYSVPSVLIQLATRGDPRRFRFETLRAVLFAGEVFPSRFLRELREQIPQPGYFNLYGPTETNVVTWYRIGSEIPDSIPIGKAIDGVEVFAVNGELAVRGPTIMSGYWGEPATPRDIYRTGDMVRQLPDGNFLFLGRRDNMIKRRGYRIALEEIEATLRLHPGIAEVSVIAAPHEENGSVVKAVMVPSGAPPSATALEHFCAARIPRSMIPDLFEFRASMPKTSTGKTDRSRLQQEFASPV